MHDPQPGISTGGLQNNYQRPNLDWVCGHLADGCPCVHGPTVGGKCGGRQQCAPVRDGALWRCTRAVAHGGACHEGPSATGQCCQQRSPCAPQRSLRFQRRVFTTGVLLATVGVLLIIWGSGNTTEFMVPGPLTSAHSQLLMHQGSQRCATCHQAAHQTLGQWVGSVFGIQVDVAHKNQSQLCLECHQENLKPEFAMVAHNRDPLVLAQTTTEFQASYAGQASLAKQILGTAFAPGQELACATCHREHHGQQIDIKAMTDQQCQACHTAAFHRFEVDHPEFQNWPQRSRKSIAFDHSSHSLKHFVQANESFACANCHQDDAAGNVKTLAPFEQACAKCHNQSMHLSGETGFAVIALPMLNLTTLQEAGISIGDWPPSLAGDFDGPLSPITRLLLRADPDAAAGLDVLPVELDWLDIDLDNRVQLEAVGRIVYGIKCLLVDLSTRGQEGLRQRLQIALDRSMEPEEAQALAVGFSATLLRDAGQKWFPALLQDVRLDDCFPRYPETAERRDVSGIGLSEPIPASGGHLAQGSIQRPAHVFGRLQDDQQVLATNPLAGQYPSSELAGQVPPTTAGPLNEATTKRRPASGREVDNLSQHPQSANARTQGAQSPDLLAENPLSPNSAVPHLPTGADANPSPSGAASESATVPNPPGVANSFVTPRVAGNSQNSTERPLSGNARATWPDQANLTPRGWLRNDDRFTIEYKLQGHQDAWLKHWLDLAAKERPMANKSQSDVLALFRQIGSPNSPGNCLQCHQLTDQFPSTPVDHPQNLVALMKSSPAALALDPSRSFIAAPSPVVANPVAFSQQKTVTAISRPFLNLNSQVPLGGVFWKATYRDPMIRSFTRFDHRPHTLQPALTDCVACHQMIEPPVTGHARDPVSAGGVWPIGSDRSREKSVQATNLHPGCTSDFHPILRAQCAACHRSGSTSNACTTCHSYHVGSRKLD